MFEVFPPKSRFKSGRKRNLTNWNLKLYRNSISTQKSSVQKAHCLPQNFCIMIIILNKIHTVVFLFIIQLEQKKIMLNNECNLSLFIVAIHEKIFIVFMMTSLCYMLSTIKLLKAIKPTGPATPIEEFSLKCKKMFFALSVAATIGLIIFFLKHRFLCHDMGEYVWADTSCDGYATYN